MSNRIRDSIFNRRHGDRLVWINTKQTSSTPTTNSKFLTNANEPFLTVNSEQLFVKGV